jgi:predicted nucleic acid-binding protein
MISLDTNVISELNRPTPDSRVTCRLNGQNPANLATTAINKAEVLVGLALLPDGKRKDGLYRETMALLKGIEFRVFPFDRDAAQLYPLIVLQRRAMRLATADGQIAAIARSRGASIATRNIGDFEHTGVQLINPWKT